MMDHSHTIGRVAAHPDEMAVAKAIIQMLEAAQVMIDRSQDGYYLEGVIEVKLDVVTVGTVEWSEEHDSWAYFPKTTVSS